MFRSLTVLVACATLCPAADPPVKDALGDPLPKGAIARLGTERMRNLNEPDKVQWHPDGKRLIVPIRREKFGSEEFALIDPRTGESTGKFAGGKDVEEFVTMSTDGSRWVSNKHSGSWAVHDTATGKMVYQDKTGTVSGDLSLSADGKRLGIRGWKERLDKGNGVKVWVLDVDTGKEVAAFVTVQPEYAALLLSADGTKAMSWGDPESRSEEDVNRVVQFWDVQTGKELGRGQASGRTAVKGVALAPAGDRAAASCGDGTIAIFDTSSGKRLKELIGTTRVGHVLAFSPDGKRVAAVAVNGHVQLWEVATGKTLADVPPPDDRARFRSLAFASPDKAVVLGYCGQTARVWEVPSGKLLSPDVGHRYAVAGIAFSDDDKEVITSAESDGVFRWDRTGKRLGEIKLTSAGRPAVLPPDAPVFLPTPHLAAHITAKYFFDDEACHAVYALPSGKRLFTMPAPDQPRAVAFAPDGKRMVTVEKKYEKERYIQRLVVIDVAAGRREREITLGPGHHPGEIAITVSPDGRKAGITREREQGQTVFTGVDLDTGDVLGESEWKAAKPVACPDNKSVLAFVRKPARGASLDVDDLGGELVLFDLQDGKKFKEYAAVEHDLRSGPQFSPDGKRMVLTFVGREPQVLVYDWQVGKVSHTFNGQNSSVCAFTFSKDGKTLATGSYDTTVLLWDLTKEQ